MTDEQLLEYRKTQLAKLREENSKLREDLREGISLRDHFARLAMQGMTDPQPKTLSGKESEALVKTNRVFYLEGYAQAELDLKRVDVTDKVEPVANILEHEIFIERVLTRAMDKNTISLLDHFAGLAMQSLLTKVSTTVGSDSVAMAAYHVAHQMLKERSRGEKRDV